MSILRISQARAVNWTATNISTLATTIPFALATGNFVIVFHINLPSNTVITDTAGNTYTQVTVNGGWFWYAKNTIANASNIVSAAISPAGGIFSFLGVIQYSGVSPSTPIDTSVYTPFGAFPAVQNPFSPTFNTRVPVEVVVACATSGDATAAQGAGWTVVIAPATGSSEAQLIEEQFFSTLQTGIQATFLESSLANWGCFAVAVVGTGQTIPGSSGQVGAFLVGP